MIHLIASCILIWSFLGAAIWSSWFAVKEDSGGAGAFSAVCLMAAFLGAIMTMITSSF